MQDKRDLEAKVEKADGAALPPVVIERFSWPVLLTVFGLLVAAFLGGMYTLDYLNRRRHGGFRV